MRRLIVQIWLLILAPWLFANGVNAAFILDDFDEAVEIFSPQMKHTYVDTFDVGPLQATRSSRIAVFQGNPDGFLDANVTSPSTLTAEISNLNPVPLGATLVSIQANYEFLSTDFSQGGHNNAFFFDFIKLTSNLPPSFLLILLRDGQDVYAHIDQSVPLSSGPFTLVIPFDQFPPRGGGVGLPDYSRIQSLNLELRASEISGGGPDPLNFFMQLDRIRIGRIPEPNSLVLLAWGPLPLILTRLRSLHLSLQ